MCTIPDKLIEKYPSLLKNIKFTGKEEKDDIGFVSVHVDRTFDDEKISLSYSLMEMKYKDYKKWNSSHEESEQLILAFYIFCNFFVLFWCNRCYTLQFSEK